VQHVLTDSQRVALSRIESSAAGPSTVVGGWAFGGPVVRVNGRMGHLDDQGLLSEVESIDVEGIRTDASSAAERAAAMELSGMTHEEIATALRAT